MATNSDTPEPNEGTVIKSTTIECGRMNEDGCVVIRESTGSIMTASNKEIVHLPYGMSKISLEELAAKKGLRIEKASMDEWVIGETTTHVMFKDEKIVGEKLNMPLTKGMP